MRGVGVSQKRLALGRQGEEWARRYLIKKGYRFVDRNFSCPVGEVDLIFIDRGILVFVEVKTRWSQRFGSPEAALTPPKLRSIIRTAHWFMRSVKNYPAKARVDLVAIDVDSTGGLIRLNHLENITA